jgi:hypothetical protein
MSEEEIVAKHAIVVMCEPGEDHPGGQGRMLHALNLAKDLRANGEEVTLWFHGIGVTWLTAFDKQQDKFTQVYRPLFDEVRDLIGGTCEFCTVKRFGAAPSAAKLGIPVLRSGGDHHTLAALIAQGHQVVTF